MSVNKSVRVRMDYYMHVSMHACAAHSQPPQSRRHRQAHTHTYIHRSLGPRTVILGLSTLRCDLLIYFQLDP